MNRFVGCRVRLALFCTLFALLAPIHAQQSGAAPVPLKETSLIAQLLSGTTPLHRAFLCAGDEAQLVIFDALPHAFWKDHSLPETREADEMMASFSTKPLDR